MEHEIGKMWKELYALFREVINKAYPVDVKTFKESACGVLCDFNALSYDPDTPSGARWIRTFLAFVAVLYEEGFENAATALGHFLLTGSPYAAKYLCVCGD